MREYQDLFDFDVDYVDSFDNRIDYDYIVRGLKNMDRNYFVKHYF